MKPIKELLYDYAFKHIGLPYMWGGSNAVTGYDCSGFVTELLKAFGLVEGNFDSNSTGLFQRFKGNLRDAPAFGCLVFFGATKETINHVGFAISDKLMIEAGGGGSTTVSLEDAKEQGAWIRLRPIARRKDLVAIVEPNWWG